jgi:hypothetical protein
MLEPVTLAALGGLALTKGIEFLYAQAGEAIKRHYENKKFAQQATAIPSEVKVPDIVEGELKHLTIHTAELEKVVTQLEPLAAELSAYGNGYKSLESTDIDTLQKMDSLRRLLEAVYKQPLTFRGERRSDSAINVDGHVNVTDLYGTAVGTDVGKIMKGNVTGEVVAEKVHESALAIGTRLNLVGRSEES